MRFSTLPSASGAALLLLSSAATASIADQAPLLRHASDNTTVSPALFSELEELARIVDISYCVGLTGFGISKPFSCLGRCSEFPSFDLVTTWNTGQLLRDSCGYIALDHGRKRVVVAFRGTYSIANTVVDLSTIPQEYEPYPGGNGQEKCENCTVHMGFQSSWVTTRDYILPELERTNLTFSDYRVTLVGHSLGGAVAALAGLDLQARGFDPQVTTFGEPRVGNLAFVEYLDKRFELSDSSNHHVNDSTMDYRRVTHVDDPVPLLPLTEWGFAMHAGEIFITKPDLPPDIIDVRHCDGNNDKECIAGQDSTIASDKHHSRKRDLLASVKSEISEIRTESWGVPLRYKLWQLFFAHRDYFWRIGVCLPSGDPLGGGDNDGGHCDLGESCYACRDYPGEICCTGYGGDSSDGYDTSVATYATSSRSTSSASSPITTLKKTTTSEITYTSATSSFRYYTTTCTYTYYSYYYSPLPTTISLGTSTVTDTTTLTVSASNLIAADGLFFELQSSITEEAESSASEQLATLSSSALNATVTSTESTAEIASASAKTFAVAASASATAGGADRAWKLDTAVVWAQVFALAGFTASDGGHCPANTRCGYCEGNSGLICCFGPGQFGSETFGTSVATFATPAQQTSNPATAVVATSTEPQTSVAAAADTSTQAQSSAAAVTTRTQAQTSAAAAATSPEPETETTTATAYVTPSSTYVPASTREYTTLAYYNTTYTYYVSSYYYTQRPSSASLVTQQVTHTTTFTVSATDTYEAGVSFYSVAMSVKSDVDYSASRQSLTLTSPSASATAAGGSGSGSGNGGASSGAAKVGGGEGLAVIVGVLAGLAGVML
nr:hypothetical protein B0A51_04541 [Rachicladosporium sp. CCFEE 5018]